MSNNTKITADGFEITAPLGGIYMINILWHGPFEDVGSASTWLKYAYEGPQFSDGLYLVKGFTTKQRLRGLYESISKGKFKRWKWIRKFLRSNYAYIGESVRVENRIVEKNHDAIPTIDDQRAVWLGQITSVRAPLHASEISKATLNEKWSGHEMKEIDRMVAEHALVFKVKPTENKDLKDSTPPFAHIVINRWNVLDMNIDPFDFPVEITDIIEQKNKDSASMEKKITS